MNWKITTAMLVIAVTVACPGNSEEPLSRVPAEYDDHAAQALTAERAGPVVVKRSPWFGDLHVHTAWSLDSYVNFNPTDPDQAYRFARGEEVVIAGGRRLKLAHPLDFAAVTEHAEYLGELSLCLDPDTAQYDVSLCRDIRNEKQKRDIVTRVYRNLIIRDVIAPAPQREAGICGEHNRHCLARARSVWKKIVGVAGDHYRPGEFTTFVAYEWTGNTGGSNLHRNVIFANNQVPELPASYFEASTPAMLWRQLKAGCQAPCDVLAIPHNSNQSRGMQFPSSVSLTDARLRSGLEPLVEIVQAKGESECKTGFGTADEFCDFEKLEQRPACSSADAAASKGCVQICAEGDGNRACIAKNNYYRNALKEGLRIEQKTGVNPYRFGVVGSTDTHNGTPGATDEKNYAGVFGAEDGTAELRARTPAIKDFKPPRLHGAAGLTGVWAEENTRESLFAALKRREVFATSGTRIILRFFAGWDFPGLSDDATELAEMGYKQGVAMGGELPANPGNAAPRFLLSAMKAIDGAGLQRVQVIKGWLENGQGRERTYDVLCAGGPAPDPHSHRCADNTAGVDPATCMPAGNSGAAELTGTWQDPDFDPGQTAFYYLRVLENPSCRWSTWEALREGRPFFDDVPLTLQERAWSSPIWYRP